LWVATTNMIVAGNNMAQRAVGTFGNRVVEVTDDIVTQKPEDRNS